MGEKELDGINPDGKLTVTTAVLAMISTIIGGGIVSLPYAMYQFGLPLAIVINFLVAYMVWKSVALYLTTKDLLPDKPESLFEIGYMLMGRKSIFAIATTLAINSFGIGIVYFQVFSSIGAGLSVTYGSPDSFFAERWIWAVGLAVLLVPIILMKDLGHFTIISWILFWSITLFVFLNLGQLLFVESFIPTKNVDGDFWKPKFDLNFVSAIAITFVAYGYQTNAFPIYQAMIIKTNANYNKMQAYGLLLTGLIYVMVAVIGMIMFGITLSSNVLDNIGVEG